VRYTGSWLQFFSDFEDNDADLLCTTLLRHRDSPDFVYWPTLKLLDESAGSESYIRGFFPIYRMSNRAWLEVDREYRRGVAGHYECVIPTVLARAHLRIEDIGGDGEFVRPENVNRYYNDKSFVFRPIRYRPGKKPNTLFHPVKGKSPGGLTLQQAIERYGLLGQSRG
jgi:hypothetical protein